MLSSVKLIKNNGTSNIFDYCVNPKEKHSLVKTASKNELEELLLSNMKIDERLYSKTTTVSEHHREKNGIYFSALYDTNMVRNTVRLSCLNMPGNFEITYLNKDVIVTSDLQNRLKMTFLIQELKEVFYFQQSNQLWIVIENRTIEKTTKAKETINDYIDFSNDEFIYFVLGDKQLIYEEMPKYDIKIEKTSGELK